MAFAAREALKLDRVIFVVSPRPPHKRGTDLAPARHRLAMARLGAREFEVSNIEMRRRGPSYTIDTLRAFRGRLFLIMGSDTLGDVPTWRESDAVVRRATFAVYARPGARVKPPRGARVVRIPGPPLEISARKIRARVRRGLPIRHWVPAAVEKYIYSRRLYR